MTNVFPQVPSHSRTVNEKPILFSAPMVRAILAGTKSQTRRIIKPQLAPDAPWPADDSHITILDLHAAPVYYAECGWCPYGKPGTRLWVRETWAAFGTRSIPKEPSYVIYREDEKVDHAYGWRPSIFMPRWASRITLEIDSVRVERLQDISANDCFAEGIERPKMPTFGSEVCIRNNARNAYLALWESINGKGSWAANPWVWVVSFKRITPEAGR